MKEVACQFGDNKHLVGVLTKPEKYDGQKPAFIFISAGLLNKIGPYRLYVLMARSLAKAGFPCLRFDLGGIGDSGSNVSSGLNLYERNKQDIEHALNYLSAEMSVKQSVLVGLCSGAEDSFRSAIEYDSIKGLYLIDPHAYQTKKSKVKFDFFRVQRRLLKAVGWYSKREKIEIKDEAAESLGAVDFKSEMPLLEAKEKTAHLIEKGTRIKYVYTGGVYEDYNYVDQFYDMYEGIARTDLIEVEVLDKMGHMPLLAEDRNLLVDSILGWANQHFEY